MDPKHVQIEEYYYDLPEDRIAKYPLPDRDASKLLVYQNGEIREEMYKDLAQQLPDNSLLVFNNTKVIQARLKFKNSTGGGIEIFCLEPAEENREQASAMSQTGSIIWMCFIRNVAKKWKDEAMFLTVNDMTLSAKIIDRDGATFRMRFSWTPEELTFAEVLSQTGEIPIPPYLRRKSEDIDQHRYQTIYAKHKGSVAAPTAGLHFTPRLFEKLEQKGIRQDYVTLHVGAGTFKPVFSETIEDHEMHAEWIEVRAELINNLLLSLSGEGSDSNIIAVGTTSMRTIESLYWMGVKAHINPSAELSELEVMQWDPYSLPQNVSNKDSLTALLSWLKEKNRDQLACKTQVLIAPPYKLRIADALITNFHQPRSTLLLLIAAVVGDDWKTVYSHAMDNEYRFLSYGDGSLLFKKES
ncbi:MAG: S-adenosylmethionine:tRNA ribosyltransferase-isomerase [Saprospiraceae bacterium]